ncbi:MAG: MBL fold metallo-hydrolase [Desulfobacterales bacterium]
MTLLAYDAEQLFAWLVDREELLLLDVRNEVEFGRFKVEGPYPFQMINIPYMEFIEHEAQSVARVPPADKIRIVCAKEGSAKYVGEILEGLGHGDVGYLTRGIKSWGNLLVPVELDTSGGYRLFQFRRPGKASCSYGLAWQSELMIFDPAKNIDAYQTFAQHNGWQIIKTIETHRQADYISGSLGLHQSAGAEIVAPSADFMEAAFAYSAAKDGEDLTFSKGGGPQVKVIHTPGHTPGSTSYLIDNRYLISGDTVFIYSLGRPDLGGQAEAWAKMLFATLKEKILPLPNETRILPGHYMDWAEADENLAFVAPLGKIIEINKAVYDIDNEAAFVDYINANMRPQPEAYATIREINAGLRTADEEEQDILDLGKNECAASAMAPA